MIADLIHLAIAAAMGGICIEFIAALSGLALADALDGDR